MKLRSVVRITAFLMRNWKGGFQMLSNALTEICYAGKRFIPCPAVKNQKVAVASVNAVDPEIYVFDEPSANLDMYSVEALKNLMRELKEEGHTIIVAEHRLYYLTGLADRFLYMEKGSIKAEWTPEELLSMSEAKRQGYRNKGGGFTSH